jgi:hypothetical protein
MPQWTEGPPRGSGAQFFAHGGVNEGFECWRIALAETGQGVVIMPNADHATELIDEMVKHIRQEYAWPQ